MNEISLIIADDHPLFRQGVVEALSLESDIRIVAQASDGNEALEQILSLKPTVAILDVNMPGLNGQQVTYRVSSEHIPTRVVLLTGYDDIEQAIHAMLAGAAGYCAKDIEPAVLARTVRAVSDGKFAVSGNVFNRRELDHWIDEQMEGARRSYSEPGAPFHPLSDREMEVLSCVVRGMSNKEIASLLGISHQTVKNHVTSILRKFSVEDRTQAVVYALKRGWVKLQFEREKDQEYRMSMDMETPPAELDLQAELEETQKALREITLMIEQSQVEVSKLSQRNAAITTHLQQVQNQLDKMPQQEIRTAYDSALDAQQRLFVMRGQLEKLQSEKSHLERFKATLERARAMAGGGSASASSGGAKNPLASVEMLVNAQETERQRLSRQMHDGPAQALSNFILQTEIAMRLMDLDTNQARDELNNLKGSAMGTFQKVRNFIFELRPMMLDDLGLVPTIRRYSDAFKEQTGMDVSVTITGNERRLQPYLEVMLFRAIQELLGNAARHGQANLVKVLLDMGEDRIRVSVDDNGKGFDLESVQQGNSLGLKLIRERAEMLGGNFEMDSAAGKGARITFAVSARS